MRRLTLFLVFLSIALGGCTTINTMPISDKARTEIDGQSVTRTHRERPDFAAMTPGKAAFAVIGAIAMIKAGNDIITTNDVTDPADAIAETLLAQLQVAFMTQNDETSFTATEDSISALKEASKGRSRYVLDVQTINWSFGYFPTDWTHYRVIYLGRARLIDIESEAVIAEGVCRHIPESNEGAPTCDQLLSNRAAVLKKTLANIAQTCGKTLTNDMFGIGVATALN